jgi:ribosome maturation protein Sdo1
MAKDKSTDYTKLTLGAKIPLKQAVAEIVEAEPAPTPPKVISRAKEAVRVEVVPKKVEQAVNAIHAPQRIVKPMKTDERTLRVTLDIPLSLHAQIRTKTFQDGISMKEYFLELAKQNLGIA